jgi:hypothetical protein
MKKIVDLVSDNGKVKDMDIGWMPVDGGRVNISKSNYETNEYK